MCQSARHGDDADKDVEDRNPGLREENAAKFAAIAATAYCPSALPHTTGTSGPQ